MDHDAWRKQRSFAPGAFAGVLAPGGPEITVIVPARDEQATIAGVLAPLIALRDEGLVHEVAVALNGSRDATGALAREAGARVIEVGDALGKGDAVWRAQQEIAGEIVCLVDADLIARERPQYVVNFAAQSMVGESWANPDHWFMTNAVSTVRLHERLRHFDFMDRYVHITTPEVYGSTSGFIREDQPFNPSKRDFNIGAITVFTNVWPVLKSLPAMGTLFFLASSCSAGMSLLRLGDPLREGTPSFRAAYA